MILLSNNQNESYNYINRANSAYKSSLAAKTEKAATSDKLSSSAEAEDTASSSSSNASTFSDTAAILSLSKDALRGTNKLARVQKYMSRSLQLENEASQRDITVAERQTIKNEINKITLVVNNIDESSDNSATEVLENSIQLYGDMVSHDNDEEEEENFNIDSASSNIEASRRNILGNASDAIIAQATINNMDALALLA